MDIPRQQKKSKKKFILGGAIAVGLVLVTVGISRLEPAPPTVDAAVVYTDTVRQGTMLREVRAPGTLEPERVRWVSAVTAGRVEQIHVEPGAQVQANTILMELTNPDVQLELLEAERQLTAAEAELANLNATLESQRLNQRAAVATACTQYNEALRQARTAEQLAERRLIAENDVTAARERAEEQRTRCEVERERLEVMTSGQRAQLTVQENQIQRLRSMVAFRRQQLSSMRVPAGAEGVVRDIPWEVGQWVNPGEVLARVVEPGRLKAVLRIPETQASDVQLGQRATIDTRNGIVEGVVARIDPAVQNGTVTVDVRLTGDLPTGARPDLSVDGVIEIERLDDVLYVGRPAFGQPNQSVGLFEIAPDGASATRVNVRLGRSSVNTVEILSGLQRGDVVILSDMSAYDDADRVRIR